MPTKKTAPKKTASRKAPKASPKAREASQLDRIEKMLLDIPGKQKEAYDYTKDVRSNILRRINDFEDRTEAKIDAIQSQLASLSQPTVEQAAPQPLGLQPGDYTDASKETADALTAMGLPTYSKNTLNDNDWPGFEWREAGYLVGCTNGSGEHLAPAEFLSRAAVTAKEIGLVPKVEKWVPKVGDWVVVLDTHTNDDAHGTLVNISGTLKDYAYWSGGGGSFKSIRPATDAEVQQHLAEQEARANAEKIAKLKAMKTGTPIKVKGKKQCTFIALDECLVWYSHKEDGSYYAALCGASELTVIEQP